MKDFLEQEITAGDTIVFVDQAYSGAGLTLKKDKISKLTPKRVKTELGYLKKPEQVVKLTTIEEGMKYLLINDTISNVMMNPLIKDLIKTAKNGK